MAESSNEHESVLAMEMAGRLLKRHNLRQTNEDLQNNYVYAIINGKSKRIEAYQRRIILILKKYFYVEVLYASLYDPLNDDVHKTFEIFGKKENVEIAEYCYHFLNQKLTSFWQENNKSFTGNKRIAKKSYYLGLLQGFSDKLQDQANTGRRQAPNLLRSESSAKSEVVAVGDTALQRFIHSRYPRISRRSIGRTKIYRDAFDNGIQTGRTIVIHKGIAEAAGNNGNLLENFETHDQ